VKIIRYGIQRDGEGEEFNGRGGGAESDLRLIENVRKQLNELLQSIIQIKSNIFSTKRLQVTSREPVMEEKQGNIG